MPTERQHQLQAPHAHPYGQRELTFSATELPTQNHKSFKISAIIILLAICPMFGGLASTAAPLGTQPSAIASGSLGNSHSRQMLRLTERRDGDVIHFLVQNIEAADVTTTFDLKLINLRASTTFPYTTTVGPHQTVEAFTLSRVDETKQWHFDLTNAYTMGSSRAVHDDRYEYSLPYQPGKSHRVSQADDGAFSHSGPERHAVDWEMPEGTPVLAARDGVVVDTKDDSDSGGPDRSFQAVANYILIQHPDGTIGNYAHLLQHGVKVSVGQRIRAGELIGLSGNTGFSSGPHLHFSVFKTRNGHERESIPIHFRTESGSETLVSGRAYKAPSTLIATRKFADQAFHGTR